MSNKIKDPSPLVEAALSLDNYLTEIVRLGAKIEESELKSEFDYEQMQKLMARFAECGEGVAVEVANFSKHLTQARTQAEAAANLVSAKAELVQARQNEHQNKMTAFQALGEKVRTLTLSLNDLRREEGSSPLTTEERQEMTARLNDFETKLNPLIDEARGLKKEAQVSKMKVLEQGADSLEQSLTAIGRRLETFKNAEALH